MSHLDGNPTKTNNEALDAIAVADYLRKNPDFFNQHAELLADIALAHDCGQATSLIERQTQVMRQKIQDDTARMSDILSTARRNDVQFEKTKRLVIELAAATHLNGLTEALKQSFTAEFHSDAVHLVLFSALKAMDNHPNLSSTKNSDQHVHYADIEALASKNWAYCQAFKGAAMEHLFPDHEQLKSCAIVPLYLDHTALGVIIIVSKAADHYSDQLDTLFLNHVAAVTSRCLGRI
jgi:uncharacterized protein YigA (DUF484 family)|tara:strand:+ start:182 stop:889 length:708 start_codon:yes stop_codon:yes gene_type:complete